MKVIRVKDIAGAGREVHDEDGATCRITANTDSRPNTSRILLTGFSEFLGMSPVDIKSMD